MKIMDVIQLPAVKLRYVIICEFNVRSDLFNVKLGAYGCI